MKTCIRFRCLDRVIFYLDRKCRISDGKQVLLSILGTAVSIVSPYITGNIITDISSGHSLFPILHKCKVLLLLFLLSHAMGVFSSVLKLILS